MTFTLPEKPSSSIDLTYDEYVRVLDTERRHLYLYGEIKYLDEYISYADASPTQILRETIERINEADIDIPTEKRKPIILYIDSIGGDVNTGMTLADVIEISQTPVYTVNVGQWSSMAFLIGIVGKKRFSYPSSLFLLHGGSIVVGGSNHKVYDQAEFWKQYDFDKIRSRVLKHSHLSAEEYDKKTRVEWLMRAEQAKEHGFIDEIVTDLNAFLRMR